MLISRGVNLLNHVSKYAKKKNLLTIAQPTRFSHGWGYRSHADPPKGWVIAAEIGGGIMWMWILYRMFYDYEHIIGHWKYPDASKWTDEELGIPPDDSK